MDDNRELIRNECVLNHDSFSLSLVSPPFANEDEKSELQIVIQIALIASLMGCFILLSSGFKTHLSPSHIPGNLLFHAMPLLLRMGKITRQQIKDWRVSFQQEKEEAVASAGSFIYFQSHWSFHSSVHVRSIKWYVAISWSSHEMITMIIRTGKRYSEKIRALLVAVADRAEWNIMGVCCESDACFSSNPPLKLLQWAREKIPCEIKKRWVCIGILFIFDCFSCLPLPFLVTM